MINRRTTILTIISAILVAFCLPAVASAQNDGTWRRNRDRDYRRERRNDDYDIYRNGRNNGNYDTRYLRDVAERVQDNARNLERDVDRFLDNSRVNGSRREDRINGEVKEFRQAADRFRNRVGNNGNRNEGYQEAQNLLHTANRTENMLGRLRVDSRTYSDWRQIKQDLRTIAHAYNLRYDGNDDGFYRNGNGGYDPRNNRNRNRDRNGRDDNWWRQLPNIINGRP